ncbi:MAG: hypothetical protein KA408_12750 [Flavobacteriales bacterium]|nr:hypothetical protein [Flavobacteriales bacterium]
MQRTLASLFVFLSAAWAIGQTVFIPDLQFRDALNNWAPGLVDVNGDMPTDNASLTPTDWDLIVDWTPCDLTGMESLEGLLDLRITFMDPGMELTWTSASPTLQSLVVQGFPSTDFPTVANGSLQRLWVNDAPQLVTLPELSSGLQNVFVEFAPAFTVLPAIPNTVDSLVMNFTGLVSLAVPELNDARVSSALNEQLESVTLGSGVHTVSIEFSPLLSSFAVAT